MFTVQKTALLKNTARHKKMIEACDKPPKIKKKKKTFLKSVACSA